MILHDVNDPDDWLEVKRIYSFGPRQILVSCVQEHDFCGVNLSEAQIRLLIEELGRLLGDEK